MKLLLSKINSNCYASALILVVCLLIISYLSNWRNHPNLFIENYFNLDDQMFVRDYFDRSKLSDIFSFTKITSNEGPNSHYMPLVSLTFNLLFDLFKNDIKLFILTSFILHVLNTTLFYLLFADIVKHKFTIILGCSIFFLHSSQFDTLKWTTAILSHGQLVLHSLFSLLFLKLHINHKKSFYYVFSIFFAFLACLTKPLGAGVMISYPVFELMYKQRKLCVNTLTFNSLLSSLNKFSPIFLFMLILSYIEVIKYPSGNISKDWGGLSLGIHTFLRGNDLILHLFTNDTNALLLTTSTLFLICIVSIALFQKNLLMIFGLLWTIISITTILSSNFRPIESLHRYHYIPLLGCSVILIALMENFIKLYNIHKK